MWQENSKFGFLKTIISICCVIKICSCYEYKDGNIPNSYDVLTEGTYCQQLGLPGFCKKISECRVAMDAIKKGRPHKLLRCGFSGIEEVVCCPDLSFRNPVIETSTIDKSAIWSNENTDSNLVVTKSPMGNTGRIKKKRKCELMCEQIHQNQSIKTFVSFHVLDGENAEKGQFPHMAALGFEAPDGKIDWQKCGASLISSRFLLTAAHCVVCQGCEFPVKVRFGVIDINDNALAQDIDVKDVKIGNYNITTRHNDIAIVELVKDVQMSSIVYPACLYTEADDPLGLIVTGWGQNETGNLQSRTPILQYAKLEPVTIEECNSTLLAKDVYTAKRIIQSQICARSFADRRSDACTGDSGGPLQMESVKGGYYIVGIVSYGIQCGTSVPGIYTRVSAFLDWIEDIVWPS